MDRTGLYIMVFIILISTCSMEDPIKRIESRLTAIEHKLNIEDAGGGKAGK